MEGMEVWSRSDLRLIVSRGFQSNTYLLATGRIRDCVVIDPGLDREAIERAISLSGWCPVAVLCTHGHFDHIGGASWLQSSYSIPVFLHSADLKLAKLANFMMAAFKVNQRINLPDFQLIETDIFSINQGERSFLFRALPGHTPGSVAITVDDLLFSGDSLYAKKIALSRLPGENSKILCTSLSRLFEQVDSNTSVFPGHGGSATLAAILRDNQELRIFMAQQD